MIIFPSGVVGTRPVELKMSIVMAYICWKILVCCAHRFVELTDKVQSGHVAVLPLEAVTSLQDPWISPVVVIPQVVRRPRLVFDFT